MRCLIAISCCVIVGSAGQSLAINCDALLNRVEASPAAERLIRLQRAASACPSHPAILTAYQTALEAANRTAEAEKVRSQLAALAPADQDRVVQATEIARALTSKPKPTRGLSLAMRTEPHIDLSILFALNSAALKAGALPQLDQVAKALMTSSLVEHKILIEGHTDATGTEAFNQQLSERRAQSVKRHLINLGVPRDRLQTEGFGESRPVAPNFSEAGRQQNRRVSFVNLTIVPGNR